MATDKTNNLTAFLNDLADGIRVAETGSATPDNNDIPAQNFRSRIEALNLSTQTADADAAAGDILSGKTAYVDGTKVTGTIATKTSSDLTASGATVTVPAGYYASDASTSIAAGTYSASGGTLSVSSNYTGKPSVSLSLEGQTTTGATLATTEPESGYYLTVKGSSSALSGTTKVSRSAITKSATAGYVETGSSTVSSATSKSPTVTVQANSATNYITIPSGSAAVTGGGLSGGSAVTPIVTLYNGRDTNMTNITVGGKDTTNYPYYFEVKGASSSGSSRVTRAAVQEARTAGYIEDKAAADVIASASKTVTVNNGSGSTYVGLKAGGCIVSGGGLNAGAGVAVATGTGITLGTATTTQPTSGKYITVQGSGSVRRTDIKETHTAGYIPAKSATTVIAGTSASSSTKTVYYPISSSIVDTSAGNAAASQILSGKKAYVDGSLVTGTMTNRGAITTTIQPGQTYTIPAGYHSGSGVITAANGYALSGTWELTADTVYSERQSSTLTASNANVRLGFGDDGVIQDVGLTFDRAGMKIGSTVAFSYYEYTSFGKGWGGEYTYPTALLTFIQACTVSEAFYNYFTSIATQVSSSDSSSDNSIPTGTLTITNGEAYEFGIILPQYVDGNLVTTYKFSTGTGSGNITYDNVVLNMPITWCATNIMLVTSSSFSNKFQTHVYSYGDYKAFMVYNLLASSATVSVTTYECCFAPESQVLMADGNTKAVVDVEIGDKVLTYNEISGEQETNEVTALGNVKLQDYTQITMANGDIIKMNKYHPLWTEDGWKSLTRHKNMPELTENDKLLTTNGEYMAIDSIETINDMELKTYYTLKVANNNNFYVNGYLAQGKDKD